jgi:glycosyltransferase involved in cell wall biosynthesis
VVIVDDGSQDTTWDVLERIVVTTALPMLAIRLAACGGPSIPRNTGVEVCHGAVIAFTDDDCVPQPGWLAGLIPAAQAGRIVQGATVPANDGPTGPWDRTIAIDRLTGLWESCNLAMPRETFEAIGGFPVLELLRDAGRGFGEDAVLGAAVARLAGGSWAPGAVVTHRWISGRYRDHLAGVRRLEAMPDLVARVPELRARAYGHYFRNRRSAACTLAVAALVTATALRRPSPLLASAPWLALVTSAARRRPGDRLAGLVGREAAADVAGLVASIRGSVRARTLLL